MTAITCGNHKDTHRFEVIKHDTPASVRACYDAKVPTFLCSWVYPAGRDEDGEQILRECNALAFATQDGWHCENGHEHLAYGSPRQQAQERIEAFVEDFASRDAATAARLDAGESAEAIAGVWA